LVEIRDFSYPRAFDAFLNLARPTLKLRQL